jgi:hypothetical protein
MCGVFVWAELLWNSFGVDGWACFQCGEHMSLRAVVIHPPATTKVLQGLGGRGPPSLELDATVLGSGPFGTSFFTPEAGHSQDKI